MPCLLNLSTYQYFLSHHLSLNDDLENIGKYLNLAGKAFDAADNKLSSGKGNLFDQIKELEALGAKSKKLISKK